MCCKNMPTTQYQLCHGLESIHGHLLLLNLDQPMQLATQESKNRNEKNLVMMLTCRLSYSTSQINKRIVPPHILSPIHSYSVEFRGWDEAEDV